MTWTKFYFQRMKLTIAIALALVGFTNTSTTLVQAQIAKTVASSRVSFVPPPLPSDQEAPTGRARGGASRGSCKNLQDNKRLTALVPVTSKSVWGLTTTKYPTLWYYVPDALTSNLPIEFVLQDEKDNYVYKTTLTTPGTPSGIVSVPLSSMTAPLEIGKIYHWTVSMYCDPQEPSNSVFVKGTVQRVAVDPALTNQLETATLPERVALYAANGIWHDALTTLAELRRTYPQNATLAATWENLLQSVNLQDIAKEPIVECCTARERKIAREEGFSQPIPH
jgi:hypothetical protein